MQHVILSRALCSMCTAPDRSDKNIAHVTRQFHNNRVQTLNPMQYCPDIYEMQILLWQCCLESLHMYLVTSQKNVIPKIVAVMTLQSGGKLVIYLSSPLLSLTHLQPNSDSGEEWYSGIAAAIHNSKEEQTECNRALGGSTKCRVKTGGAKENRMHIMNVWCP